MNKILITVLAGVTALIVAGAARADFANVEVYGTLNVDFENVKATGATPAGTAIPNCPNGTCQIGGTPTGVNEVSRNRVTSNSSNIGFRGKEDLGWGLKAIFQVESGVNVSSASSTSTTGGTNSSGFWASRNSNVGLSSNTLGTAFYGNWDTPYKALTNTLTFDSFYATGIANGNTLIGTPGFGVATTTASNRVNSAADASFDRRQGNSVQYWSPQFFGISFRLLYSADAGRSSEPSTVANPNTNPAMYGASVAWEWNKLRIAYAFEQHRDYFGLSQLGGQALGTAAMGANPKSKDNGNKVTLSYQLDTSLGTTLLNAAFENLTYNNQESGTASAALATNLIHYDRNMIYLAAQHKFGANTIRLSGGKAFNGSCDRAGGSLSPCSTSGLDAKQFSAGYSYSFSKRTDLYGFYTLVLNGDFANYPLGNGSSITSTSIAAGGFGGASNGIGARQQGIGLGIRHAF
ncbi:MAG TPA: porin [Burkholderiales bacterium]|nr:porin [Burkholderiales bacterium]